MVHERDGVLDRKERRYWVRATQDGVQHVPVTHQPGTQGDVRRCVARPAQGCRHSLTEQLSKGAQRDIFEFDRPLRLGESYFYSFDLLYEYNSREAPIEMFQAEYLPNEDCELIMTAQFAAPRPRALWYFEEIAMMVAPGEPARETLLKLDDAGQVKRRFSCRLIRMGYGLAWRF
jgi:hypothetical protein